MSYHVYTREYDQVVRPQDLLSQEELDERAEIFHTLCPVSDFEPLRERLEGLRQPTVPTIVTMLVDNSGSMRGAKIAHAVGAVGIIGMYLDRLGVPNEILGFTTRAWKGGNAREKWILDGKPRSPGRLNELMHVVYKTPEERLVDVRSNLALMMREGFLKENVDGEAVEWAVERLRAYPAARRILLVISDGAPIDDSTLGANAVKRRNRNTGRMGDSYLSRHLIAVIKTIRKQKDIRIDAIGMEHDVSDFYGVGDRIEKMHELAPVAIAKLEKLLSD